MTDVRDTHGLWAIVPAKDFARAKSRMAHRLTAAERVDLARSMLTHVLGVSRTESVIARTVVVTDSDEVAHLAQQTGARVLRDPAGARSLADVVDAALHHASTHGAHAALVLMGDLPNVTGDDLRALAGALHDVDVVLAPDRRDAHTNALALRLDRAFATSFGHPQSLARHRADADALGLRIAIVTRPGLALDIDDTTDLELSLGSRADRA